jgi:cardiolipin synthase
MWPDLLTILGILATVTEILGVISAVNAIMSERTAEGAIAWALSLIMFPYIALPFYWVFGRNRLPGYAEARRAADAEIEHIAHGAVQRLQDDGLVLEGGRHDRQVYERLGRMQFTHANRVQLLINGEATFDAIFAAIDAAEQYVLIQYFIVRDDRVGRALKDRLIRKAAAGVRVYFLYDAVGSYSLTRRYVRELTNAGVRVATFRAVRGRLGRFQLNFRNHRKIVVVDGRAAFVGGLNVGDEYVGRDRGLGPWRDTHIRVEGPAVPFVQLAFFEDWYWLTREIPDLNWVPARAPGGDKNVLVLASGPADDLETCGLFFVHTINAARERLWIASPYFVPDVQVVCALQLAALRGVDVRIMLPERPDHLLVYLSAFSFLAETEQAGVKIYRYQPGFMHNKTILVDDDLAAVGTANLDNRSFRLNFEVTVVVDDREFAAEVARMFERDFEQCQLARADDLHRRSFWFQVAVRVARLMSPVQ